MAYPYHTSNSVIGNFYGSRSNPLNSYSSYSDRHSVSSYLSGSTQISKSYDSPRGLENLTNTCYISAILQVLFPIIKEKDFPVKSHSSQEVTSHFFRLKETKSRSEYRDLKQVLQQRIEIVRGWQQQDAHEFLVYLLQQLRKQNRLPLKTGKPVDFTYKEEQNTQKNWENFNNEMLKLENSKIIELFSGEIIKRLTCQKGHDKHSFGRINNLSLSFPQQNTSSFYHDTIKLKQMVKDYFGPQEIEDLFCQKCKMKKIFKKDSVLYSGPKYLILHLSRFIKGYYQNEKNKNDVEFDDTLTLQTVRQKSLQYKLVGIVHHTGSLNHGHYYADVLISGEWFQMNDQKVYRQKIKQKGNISSTVYLLIYQRVTK